jgi:hypothetical protein
MICISCGIEYEGETKLITKGRILDVNNQPLANIPISMFDELRNSGNILFFPGSREESIEISNTKTDANGYYLMITPKPKNTDERKIKINSQSDSSLQSKTFSAITNDVYYNYELDLGSTKIYQKNDIVNLMIVLNQVNFNHRVVNIQLLGEDATFDVAYQPFLFSTENFYTFLNPFQVLKNQTLLIEYEVLNIQNNSITSYTQTMNIANENVSFTINY